MSLQVTLDGESEAIIRSQLALGYAQSPEELITRTLSAYSGVKATRYSLGKSRKTPPEAVKDICDLRAGVTHSGLKVKDLAHEGHKY